MTEDPEIDGDAPGRLPANTVGDLGWWTKTLIELKFPIVLLKNVQQTLSAVLGIVIAKAEQASQGIRDSTEARTAIAQALTEHAIRATDDKDLAHRTLNYHLQGMFKAQKNREQVVKFAIEHIQRTAIGTPPALEQTEEGKDSASQQQTEPPAMDEDWLTAFSQYAEKTSKETVQQVYGRILAGEINRPGSFSLSTLQTLSLLDGATADIFNDLCAMICTTGKNAVRMPPVILVGDLGAPSNNGFAQYGFDYRKLAHLIEAGFIQAELNAWTTMHPVMLTDGIHIGRESFHLVHDPGMRTATMNAIVKVNCMNLTQRGRELSLVCVPTIKEAYRDAILTYIHKSLGYRRV